MTRPLPPLDPDLQGSFLNVFDRDRIRRRAAWVQDALTAGLTPKEIAERLGITHLSVNRIVRDNDLQRPKRAYKETPSQKLHKRGIARGYTSTSALFDGLPGTAQAKIEARAARTGKSLAEIFAEDLASFYNDQRRG